MLTSSDAWPSASPEARALYEEKLVEMPWNPAYVVFGHLGDHLGAASPGFVKEFMAPIVLDAQRRRAAGTAREQAREEPEGE